MYKSSLSLFALWQTLQFVYYFLYLQPVPQTSLVLERRWCQLESSLQCWSHGFFLQWNETLIIPCLFWFANCDKLICYWISCLISNGIRSPLTSLVKKSSQAFRTFNPLGKPNVDRCSVVLMDIAMYFIWVPYEYVAPEKIQQQQGCDMSVLYSKVRTVL